MRTLIGWIVVSGVIAVTLAIMTSHPQGSGLVGPEVGSSEAMDEAIQRVRAHTRNGLRFDTWLDRRVERLCRFARGETPSWTADVAFDGGDAVYLVDYSYGEIPGCPETVTYHAAIAVFRARFDRIEPNGVEQPPPDRSWLGDFEAGDAP